MTPTAAEEVRFLLVPGFSLIAFTSALEPMRLANRISGRGLYHWRLLSLDGLPVASGDGGAVDVADPIDLAAPTAPPAPTFVLCGGPGCERYQDPEVAAWLRRWARFGATIGALGSAAYPLARAGLLAGRRCTTHWQSLPAFAEAFPELETTGDLFEIDRDRFTCAGGAAALDLTLHRIATAHGPGLAAAVSEACLLDRVRAPDKPQRRPWHVRLGGPPPEADRGRAADGGTDRGALEPSRAGAPAGRAPVPTLPRLHPVPTLPAAPPRGRPLPARPNRPANRRRRLRHGLRLDLALRDLLPPDVRQDGPSAPGRPERPLRPLRRRAALRTDAAGKRPR